jgi:uncharacterized protein YndB with AHSA1/START domain
MKERSAKAAKTTPASELYTVAHSTFSIDRSYPVPPPRVYAAFADPATKRRWFVDGEGWRVFDYALDFRVGGAETSRFRFKDGEEMTNDTQYQDIVADKRIVFSYRMATKGKVFSASLATIELIPVGEGTLLTTEQAAFFDGVDTTQRRNQGWRSLFDRARQGAGELTLDDFGRDHSWSSLRGLRSGPKQSTAEHPACWWIASLRSQ